MCHFLDDQLLNSSADHYYLYVFVCGLGVLFMSCHDARLLTNTANKKSRPCLKELPTRVPSCTTPSINEWDQRHPSRSVLVSLCSRGEVFLLLPAKVTARKTCSLSQTQLISPSPSKIKSDHATSSKTCLPGLQT